MIWSSEEEWGRIYENTNFKTKKISTTLSRSYFVFTLIFIPFLKLLPTFFIYFCSFSCFLYWGHFFAWSIELGWRKPFLNRIYILYSIIACGFVINAFVYRGTLSNTGLFSSLDRVTNEPRIRLGRSKTIPIVLSINLGYIDVNRSVANWSSWLPLSNRVPSLLFFTLVCSYFGI